MELSKSVSMTTFLWLLAELSIATGNSRPPSRGRTDHYARSRPERFESRIRAPPQIRTPPQIYPRPRPFPRPILDPRFDAGRRPFPNYPPHKQPVPEYPPHKQPVPEYPPHKPTPPTDQDPADLSTLFGHCSRDPSMNVQSIFSGMFLSSTDLEELVLDTEAEMMPFTLENNNNNNIRRKQNRYVEENRFQQTIGTVQEMAPPGDTAGNTCCETKLVITAPGKVVVDGQSMSVVHMNHSYQYVQEGLCTSPNLRCRDIGQCTQMYKYAFLLMYDPQLVGRVNPPVRYGRVQIKSHCECMNIGTTGK